MKNLPDKKPKDSIKLGDIFVLGDHRLICGDAQDEQILKILMGDDKINALITDPPYSVGYVESKENFKQKLSCNKKIANDQLMTEDEYSYFTEKWLKPIIPYFSKKNTVYIFNSDRMIFAVRDVMLKLGYKFSQLLIWVKNNAVVGRLDYQPQHELIAYGWHGRHKFKKSKDKSVLVCPRPQKSKLHPTMKPISLMRRLILNSTNIGDVIYDPFGGSGSTLIAAEQTKRKCMTMELDPEYCQIIIDRYEKLSDQKAKKLKSIHGNKNPNTQTNTPGKK